MQYAIFAWIMQSHWMNNAAHWMLKCTSSRFCCVRYLYICTLFHDASSYHLFIPDILWLETKLGMWNFLTRILNLFTGKYLFIVSTCYYPLTRVCCRMNFAPLHIVTDHTQCTIIMLPSVIMDHIQCTIIYSIPLCTVYYHNVVTCGYGSYTVYYSACYHSNLPIIYSVLSYTV